MIKCYFVDVKSISSNLPQSSFSVAEIDLLADAILAADGLLRPLILQKNGVEKYTVIEGHREYYAAVRAKEKDIKKAEMVNAFVIDTKSKKSAIDQLKLLTQPQPPSEAITLQIDTHTVTELIAVSIDRLLPEIIAAISTQIQPIFFQLAEHKQILDTIKLASINEPTTDSKNPLEAQEIGIHIEPSKQDIKSATETNSTSNSKKAASLEETLELNTPAILESPIKPDLPKTKPETVPKATTRNSRKPKPEAKPSSPIPVVTVELAKQPVTASTKQTKPTVTKTSTTIVNSLDLDKSTNALNLINTLSQGDLTLRMERSGVSKAIIKLVASIVLQRDLQPSQKFDTWEDLVAAKISGLTPSKVQDIIKKLK